MAASHKHCYKQHFRIALGLSHVCFWLGFKELIKTGVPTMHPY